MTTKAVVKDPVLSLEEKYRRLAEYMLGSCKTAVRAARDPVYLKQWWDKMSSDTKANCPPYLIPEGW